MQQADEPLGPKEHSGCRSTVGKLVWLIFLRHGTLYDVKELARCLTGPTQQDQTTLKHLLRHLRGTMSLVTVLRPQTQYKLGTALDVNAYTDSDWAGCHKTRQSTSGTAVQVLGCTVTAVSRTQQTLALSSGEAELYAIGTSVLESLRLRRFLLETEIAKTCTFTIHTDSTAAKVHGIAARHDTPDTPR